MEKLSLHSMGIQFAQEAEHVMQMITACKERKRFAMAGGNSTEAARQERLMELHMQQRKELLRLAAKLRNYYDQDSVNNTKEGETDENHQSFIA